MSEGFGDYQTPVDYKDTQPNGNGGQGMAIAAMVLGIVSIVLCCIWYISLLCAIVGIVLGVMHNKKGVKSGMATAGIVCSIIGIILTIVILVLAAIGLAMFGGLAALQDYSM